MALFCFRGGEAVPDFAFEFEVEFKVKSKQIRLTFSKIPTKKYRPRYWSEDKRWIFKQTFIYKSY